MNIGSEAPVFVANPDDHANIRASLSTAFAASQVKFGKRCQLLICIVDGKKDTYQVILI